MKKVLLLLVLSFSFSFIFAQKNVIDKIVAIVGDEIILQSDIEKTEKSKLRFSSQNGPVITFVSVLRRTTVR